VRLIGLGGSSEEDPRCSRGPASVTHHSPHPGAGRNRLSDKAWRRHPALEQLAPGAGGAAWDGRDEGITLVGAGGAAKAVLPWGRATYGSCEKSR